MGKLFILLVGVIFGKGAADALRANSQEAHDNYLIGRATMSTSGSPSNDYMGKWQNQYDQEFEHNKQQQAMQRKLQEDAYKRQKQEEYLMALKEKRKADAELQDARKKAGY